MGQVVDLRADYLYHRVTHGFDIVDPDCDLKYCCANYSSIKSSEFKCQMDSIVRQEIEATKVSRVHSRVQFAPDCVHALGAVKKSNGKLMPITDCSINGAMSTTFAPFKYVTLDKICDGLKENEFMAVVDIKAAYTSINISPGHCRFQGYRWELDGMDSYYTDNCICF